MTHTPGPWERDTFSIFALDRGGLIAKVYSPGSIMDERMSNAHLIAAAPEMLELLETIENDANTVPDWLWKKITACVQKAKGL